MRELQLHSTAVQYGLYPRSGDPRSTVEITREGDCCEVPKVSNRMVRWSLKAHIYV